MEKTFREIADEEHVEVIFDEKKYHYPRGYLLVTIYELNIPYKNHSIFVRNELGNHDLGRIRTELKEFSLPSFEISCKSHFWRLFNPQSNILSIKCEDFSFATFIQLTLIQTGLESLARESQFEPKIYNINENGTTSLICDYHLNFNLKELALRSLIKFFKEIITYNSRIRG